MKVTPIILEFHTFDSSTSWFELQYEITEINMISYVHNYNNYSNFKVFENNSFVFPFVWINIFLIRNNNYYNWNIFVAKMYKLFLKLVKA